MPESVRCEPIGDELSFSIGHGAVLYDTRPNKHSLPPEDWRQMVHVTSIWQEISSGQVMVEVQDGTHTYRERVLADDLPAMFEPAGFSIHQSKKPAYILTRTHGVEDAADAMTDGGYENREHDIQWSDVERIISDLKNDGYQPTAINGVPSDATRKKQIYLSVSRGENKDG